MEKKEYQPPKMEIIEMPFGGRLLDGSPDTTPDIIPLIEGECEGDCNDAW